MDQDGEKAGADSEVAQKSQEVLVSRDEFTKLSSEIARLERLITKQSPSPSPPPQAEDSPAYKGLVKRLNDTEAKVKAAEEKAREEARKAADTRMRQQLSEVLVAAGVEQRSAKHAVGYLVDAERKVRISDQGETVFQDGSDAVDLPTGIKTWVATEDAKIYLAPRGIQGSGDRGAFVAPKPKQSGPSREELAAELQRALGGGNVAIN